MKISKELLQCLNKHLTIDKVISNGQNRIDNNIYWNVKEIDILQSRNIYELAFKLKEWAFSEGYQLEISRYWNIPTYYCKIVMRGGDLCEECGESRAIYELEDLREIDIVVKACEYILKEINGSK